MNDDEDQAAALVDDDEDQAVPGELAVRGMRTLGEAGELARQAGEPVLMFAGTFKLYADPTGALVIVVEKPGEEPHVKVFNRRTVRLMSKMLPAMFGAGRG